MTQTEGAVTTLVKDMLSHRPCHHLVACRSTRRGAVSRRVSRVARPRCILRSHRRSSRPRGPSLLFCPGEKVLCFSLKERSMN